MKNINWLDHIANLLVVILGISIAFYMEGWREDAGNRMQERKYLESMVTDLQTDIEALDTLLSINEELSAALVNLSLASVGRPYGSDSALMYQTLKIQYNPPFTPQRTAYESLKASGKMDLINDFELRNHIVDLYEQFYRGTAEYDDALDEHVRDFVKPYYMKNVRFTGPQSIDPAFLNSDEFRNIIFAYRYLFIAKDEFYKNVLNKTDSVKNEIVGYLESQ
ncbi:DUF6090 family protein [Ekhidna sp.]|jgi:hypothetical protein|uniref:DUF6090 family protein n=1 Tax=Ekhidna sp. TaxID=2608089 RepID=UPI0032F0728D